MTVREREITVALSSVARDARSVLGVTCSMNMRPGDDTSTREIRVGLTCGHAKCGNHG